MSLFSSLNVSATGLTAQRLRIDVISKNIANADVTRTPEGTPYRRQRVVFESANVFQQHFDNALKDGGVKVTRIEEDMSPLKKVFDPGHPDSDKDGYVLKPNVDVSSEMVDLISAYRSFEANVAAINATKNILNKGLEIGRI